MPSLSKNSGANPAGYLYADLNGTMVPTFLKKATPNEINISKQEDYKRTAVAVFDKINPLLQNINDSFSKQTDAIKDAATKAIGDIKTASPIDPDTIANKVSQHLDGKFKASTGDLSGKTWGFAAAGMAGITGLGHYVNNNYLKPFPAIVKSMDLKHYLMVGGAAALGVLAGRNFIAHEAEQGEKFIEQKTTTRQRSH